MTIMLISTLGGAMHVYNSADLKLAIKIRFSRWRVWRPRRRPMSEVFGLPILGVLPATCVWSVLMLIAMIGAAVGGVDPDAVGGVAPTLVATYLGVWGVITAVLLRIYTELYWKDAVARGIERGQTLDELVEKEFGEPDGAAGRARMYERFLEIASTELASAEKIVGDNVDPAAIRALMKAVQRGEERKAVTFRKLLEAGPREKYLELLGTPEDTIRRWRALWENLFGKKVAPYWQGTEQELVLAYACGIEFDDMYMEQIAELNGGVLPEVVYPYTLHEHRWLARRLYRSTLRKQQAVARWERQHTGRTEQAVSELQELVHETGSVRVSDIGVEQVAKVLNIENYGR